MASITHTDLTPNTADSDVILRQKEVQIMNTLLTAVQNTGGASQAVYAAGTAYSLTDTAAALDFGTTDPTLTIDTTGTYLILAKAALKFTGATFAAVQTATLKLRRTNNTAADLTSGTRTISLSIVTTISSGIGVVDIAPVVYSATAGDVLSIFGSVSAAPAAGSVDVTSAEIVAIRLR